MTDRLPSDHDAVDSHRTHREQIGRTSRPRIPVPAAVDVAVGDVIRLSLSGAEYHAQVTDSHRGETELRGAYDNAALARSEEGENHLQAWVADAGLEAGDAVVFDVVTPGYKFGLRCPGERVVYTATAPPDDSLADIARDIDG